MAKKYIRINFEDAPSTATPLDKVTLNKMDAGIDELDTWRDSLIVDNVASTLTDKALSAKQGKLLNDKVTTLNESLAPKDETSSATIVTNSNYNILSLFVDKSGNNVYVTCIVNVTQPSATQIACVSGIPAPFRPNYMWMAPKDTGESIGIVVLNGNLLFRGGTVGKQYQLYFNYVAK